MTDYLNSLTTIEFAILLVAAFLTALQLTTLARHAIAGSAASVIPGVIAVVLWVVLFGMTH